MGQFTMDYVSSMELHNDDSVLEVIDWENNTGLYTTSLDMTSLAAFLNTDALRTNANMHREEPDDRRLTLAYERLHTIPLTLIIEFGPSLTILDVSHNRISKVEFLNQFKNLTSFIADNNFINENTVFPYMPKLELLWLNHCRIAQLFPWIKRLRGSCPNLKHICLMGNPAAPSYLNGGTFYEYLQYRLFVISMFPSLIHLDDRPVTEDQKLEAKRLYKRPLLERLSTITKSDSATLAEQNGMLLRWKELHSKMFGMFDSQADRPSSNRNLLI